ncbi:MAG: carboxy terminal-processing peptidase [Verrucomicrobiaceae bacterium]|nr:carboxy terminal-processing peptidase [Verrucomicrobiaceae bacterium]
MTRSPLSLLAAALAAVSFSSPAPAPAATNFGQVAMHVAYMLQNHHYSHAEFDDKVSGELLTNYLNMLDFRHVFFTQADVDSFKAKYDTTLDDHILMRNISPALEIYDVYSQRVRDRVDFVRRTLASTEFKFDSDRTVEINRDKSPWPADEAASDKLWMDILEENLLQEKLVELAKEADAKKKAENAAKKAAEKKDAPAATPPAKPEADKTTADAKPADAKADAPKAADAAKSAEPEKKLTATEKVLKDYERLLDNLNENDQEDIVNYFLSSLATSFDPHTEYMSQNEIENFNIQMKHSLVGIGALLGIKDDVAEIQGIVVNGPADKQGELRLNDRILAVAQGEDEFVDVKYMKLQKIVDMIRGKDGSVVRLKVMPAADPNATTIIAITRTEVELKEKLANAELIVTPPDLGKEMRVGWINLSSFYADMEEGKVSTTVDVERLLRRLMKEKIDGLVLDLRGNGGGSLEEAIKLTGLFVPAGPVVQAKDWKGNITWRECENEQATYSGPMIVLTDKTSASASEILAGALQDYRRALIVGDKSTYGKGTVQTILPVERYMPFFSDKSRAGALKVTIQKFYRIAGGSTQLMGVIPDLQLPSIRDVLDIGEASTPNPLPYDTIPPRTFNFTHKEPYLLSDLQSRLKSRISTNPEFQAVQEESARLKTRIDRNTVSLNLASRLKDRDEAEARRDKQDAERAKRVADVVAKIGDNGFKTYHLTLDNVDKPELVIESDFTREQSTGMRVASKAADDDGASSDASTFPYGIEPVKLETLNILRDHLELLGKSPTTAKTDEKPATLQQ